MISLNISPRGAPCPAGNLVMDNRLIIYGKSGFWVHSLFRPFRLRSVRRLVGGKTRTPTFRVSDTTLTAVQSNNFEYILIMMLSCTFPHTTPIPVLP